MILNITYCTLTDGIPHHACRLAFAIYLRCATLNAPQSPSVTPPALFWGRALCPSLLDRAAWPRCPRLPSPPASKTPRPQLPKGARCLPSPNFAPMQRKPASLSLAEPAEVRLSTCMVTKSCGTQGRTGRPRYPPLYSLSTKHTSTPHWQRCAILLLSLKPPFSLLKLLLLDPEHSCH